MQPWIIPAGVVGDGKADDTRAWQDNIAAAPDGACFLCPAGMCSVITDTIPVNVRSGLTFLNLGGNDARPRGQRGAEFMWQGPDGKDAMFSLMSSRLCQFVGVSLSFDRWPTPPKCGVRIDSLPGTQKYISTRHSFRRCVVVAPPPAKGTVGTWNAFDVSRDSDSNNEFMEFQDILFSPVSDDPWGTAVLVGTNPNAKSFILRNLSIGNAATAIYFEGGGGHVERCTGFNNLVDVQHDDVVDTFTVERCNFEHTKQCCVRVRGQSGPVRVISNRLAAPTAPYLFDVQVGCQAHFEGNRVYTPPATPNLFNGNPKPTSSKVSLRNNLWSGVIVNNPGFAEFRIESLDLARSF
jgi:hypothetical protein